MFFKISNIKLVSLRDLNNLSVIRAGGVILKVEGLNYLVSKEGQLCLGPTGQENFSNLGPLDRLKLTPNSKIFHSKAFIKQEFTEIKKRMCNITKRYNIFKISNTKIKAKKISKGYTMAYGNYKSSFVNFPNIRILLSSD